MVYKDIVNKNDKTPKWLQGRRELTDQELFALLDRCCGAPKYQPFETDYGYVAALPVYDSRAK